ncbi:MAG: hypothetical protein WB660_22210, partial [Candidatus Sulfotelmatobacter sp.]
TLKIKRILHPASIPTRSSFLACHNRSQISGVLDGKMALYGIVGFGDHKIDSTRCFGHNGGAPGMNGDLEICPGPGYVVAVLANMDPPAASRVSDFISNRLPK